MRKWKTELCLLMQTTAEVAKPLLHSHLLGTLWC